LYEKIGRTKKPANTTFQYQQVCCCKEVGFAIIAGKALREWIIVSSRKKRKTTDVFRS